MQSRFQKDTVCLLLSWLCCKHDKWSKINWFHEVFGYRKITYFCHFLQHSKLISRHFHENNWKTGMFSRASELHTKNCMVDYLVLEKTLKYLWLFNFFPKWRYVFVASQLIFGSVPLIWYLGECMVVSAPLLSIILRFVQLNAQFLPFLSLLGVDQRNLTK